MFLRIESFQREKIGFLLQLAELPFKVWLMQYFSYLIFIFKKEPQGR